jgi:hypothetical protein
MPYESEAQRGYMHVHHPEIAKRWDREYPNQGPLPYHKTKENPIRKRLRDHGARRTRSRQ